MRLSGSPVRVPVRGPHGPAGDDRAEGTQSETSSSAGWA